MAKFCIVLVTAPNRKVARQLAAKALQGNAAACANLLPGIESHYWWKSRLEKAVEVLIIFKTTARQVRSLENIILVNHPYDTPEFVVLPLAGGNRRYLDWLAGSVEKPQGNPKPHK